MLDEPMWWSVRPHLLLTLIVLMLACVAAWIGATAYATETPWPQAMSKALHLLSYLGR
jgi:hypothetical protein